MKKRLRICKELEQRFPDSEWTKASKSVVLKPCYEKLGKEKPIGDPDNVNMLYGNLKNWEKVLLHFKNKLLFVKELKRELDSFYLGRLEDVYPNLAKEMQININIKNVEKITQKLKSEKMWLIELKGDEIISTTIKEQNLETNFFNAGSLNAGNDTWHNAGISRILIKINFNSLPKNLNIVLAKLYLYRVGGWNSPISVHKLLSDWNEKEVSWNKSSKDTVWNTAGGFFDKHQICTDTRSIFTVGHSGETYSFEVASIVQAVIKNKKNNYGFLLKECDENEPSRRGFTNFCNRSSKLHPRFMVIFKSKIKPEMEEVVEYEYDIVDLYVKGIDLLLAKQYDEANAYWRIAYEKSNSKLGKYYIKHHMEILGFK